MSKKSEQTVSLEKKPFKLPSSMSELEANATLMHSNVVRQLGNKRAGTASTKTRSEVRGGGKKPWKQKGTGRARAGSIRSPLWVGGGITFGPKPRDYETKLNKKARNLSIAQSLVAKKEDIVLTGKLPEVSKTNALHKAIKSINPNAKSILFVASKEEANFESVKLSARNIASVKFVDSNYMGTYDVLNAETVIITEAALKELDTRISKNLAKKSKKEVA